MVHKETGPSQHADHRVASRRQQIDYGWSEGRWFVVTRREKSVRGGRLRAQRTFSRSARKTDQAEVRG